MIKIPDISRHSSVAGVIVDLQEFLDKLPTEFPDNFEPRDEEGTQGGVTPSTAFHQPPAPTPTPDAAPAAPAADAQPEAPATPPVDPAAQP